MLEKERIIKQAAYRHFKIKIKITWNQKGFIKELHVHWFRF